MTKLFSPKKNSQEVDMDMWNAILTNPRNKYRQKVKFSRSMSRNDIKLEFSGKQASENVPLDTYIAVWTTPYKEI